MNLNQIFEKTVAAYGNRPALKFAEGQTNWNTFREAVARLAHALQKLGVTKPDRVAVMLPNIPHFPISFYAALRLGAVVVPLDTTLKEREVHWQLEDSEARVLIIFAGYLDGITRALSGLPALRHIIVLGDNKQPGTLSLTRLISKSTPLLEAEDLDSDDSAAIIYTSGATGKPKGVDLSHGNLIADTEACCNVMKTTCDDVILGAVPLYHPLGQTLIMHLSLFSGASIELIPKPEPNAILPVLLNKAVTLFPTLPSQIKMLLTASGESEAYPSNPPRLCVCGGGPLHEEILKSFEARFKTYILECYITAETSPVISFNQWRMGRRVGSLGHPIPGVEMKVVNDAGEEVSIGAVGEIVVRGPIVMKGYINRPHTSSDAIIDGWFHTGDLGRMDINGFFYLVDRKHFRINKGGFSIYPREIEDLLYGHPEVREAAVVPIPSDIYGQDIKACVVLRENAQTTTEQLIDYCQKHLAMYKVPSVIRLYCDLPKDVAGRVNKNELI